MVTPRDTRRRTQANAQLPMRLAKYQLIGAPDYRSQQPAEFIPREFLPALRAAAQAAPQSATLPAPTPRAATPQASAPRAQITGNPNVPRGYRNNNPLNIIDGSFARGQPGYDGADGRFGQFKSMNDGINAADKLLQSYAERGLNTPQSIIARWAPAGDGDNNPSAYAATVARNLGVEPGAAIDMANPSVRRKLIDAMATVENGRPMSPPKLADGGLVDLSRKYADGGPVANASHVYDPDVIAAIAASVVDPRGYAEGGRAASKKKKQNRPLSLDLSDSSYDGYKPYPINTPDPKKWSPAPVPERNDQDSAASSSLTKTGKGAFWEGLGKVSPDLGLGMGSGEMGQGEVDAVESSAEGDNDALGFEIRGNVGKLGSSPYVNIGGGITLPLGVVMLMLDASYGKAIGYSAKPDISVTGGVRIPFADGGTTTGVSSDDAAPRTFADLVRRYAVGDAMQMGAPLDDPSLGAGVSQSIGDYFRPVGQGLLEIPGSIRNYAIDVAADQSPFARLGSDIGNLGSAVWKGIKEDPVGAILDVLPGVGEIRSGMDAHDMRNKAEAAERAGDERQAAVYRQLSAMGMVGAIPFFGMASRAANRGVRAGAEAAARVGLDAAAVVPRELSPLGFYSHGAETAANLAQAKGTPDQMAAMLRKYGVKPDEFYNTGIADEAATNVMRSKIERDYAPKLAAAKLEMDALGLNENTINKKSPDYNRALEIRDSPETKAKYRYDIALNAMRSEMDSAMVLRPEWASRPSVTREDLAKHFSERRPQIEETVLGKTTKSQPYPEEYTKIEQDIQSRYLGEIERLRSVYFDNAEPWSVRTEAAKKAQDLYDEMDLKINEAIPNREALIQAARDTTTPTKFQQYTLPGGENYREVLLKLSDPSNTQPQIDAISKRMDEIQDRPQNQITPELKEEWHGLITELDNITKKTNLFESTHWDDPNVLAHLRMSDRTGPNGEKILHLEEIQSDWGKKGRTEGFAGPKAAAQWEIDKAAALKEFREAQKQHTDLLDRVKLTGERLEPFKRGVESLRDFERRESKHLRQRYDLLFANPDYQATRQRFDAARDAYNALGPRPTDTGIPSAPYVTNTSAWTDLALKRALKEAAEGGYDRIVWTPGAEQVKRYDLSKQIDELAYWRAGGKIGLSASGPDGTVFDQRYVSEKDLPGVVGRELAEEILKGKGSPKSTTGFPEEIGVNFISGEGLRVGGEGMKAYYDKMVPNQLSKLVKRLDPDAKVGLTDVMLPQGTGPGMGHNNPPFEAPGLTITPKMREAIMKGQTDFAEGGSVKGYAEGGSADGSLAALYEKYHAEPTARQRDRVPPPPTYEEMANNPVGYSSVYPPQYMSNQDPNVSPVASRTLMSDAQRLGLLGRRGPVTGADLPAAEERGQELMDNAMTVAGAASPIGIRAFHGSPHKFDQFDMSKIGTGEGAQAYGHGLYFAGNEGVARGYRDKLAGRRMPPEEILQKYFTPGEIVPSYSGRDKVISFDPKTHTVIVQEVNDNGQIIGRPRIHGTMPDARKINQLFAQRNLPAYTPGHMYELNLRTHPDRLLDWDKPLAGQPDAVQKAILRNLRDPATIAAPNIRRATERALRGDISDVDGGLAHTLVDGYKNPQNAAETLRKSGIDGIQYLDGGSRGAGQGSSNYVIFDDKLIDLLRRYGLLGMIGGGAAAAGGNQAPAEEQTDYAQGGSVDSAPVYDPAVIAAIAASITEDNYA
jgi:hypothetical protein